MNRYHCSITDKSYSQAQIDKNLSDTYREIYVFEPLGSCEGCGGRGVCSAHIIAQARCKQLKLTSLIWQPMNFFRSCHRCNLVAENISNKEIRNLLNFQEILYVYKLYDQERYSILNYE